MKLKLTDLTPVEIVAELGLKPYQGRQIFRWLHKNQTFDFEGMTDLSKELRAVLQERCVAAQLTVAHLAPSQRSPGTKKALFRLMDGETVEAVLIRHSDRSTLCLSTQVGCAVKCAFCATGKSGYTRNLSPGEIVEQALHLLSGEGLREQTPNVVYMGMGEPFRNYESTVRSIHLLMAKEGLGIGARKITVSTVGDVAGIRRFAEEDWQVRLSVSLHAANDALRSRLVPINRKYSLDGLFEAVREYVAKKGRHVTFEWTLLDGVNDSPQDAAQLVERIRGLNATVNLIPYNPVPDSEFAPSSQERCRAFWDALVRAGIRATLRREFGQDIDAACGQLRRRLV